ncbi:E3 ubiquitin/ISG15 ligase TRIM25-like [Centroberyx affinis]|uniref:E3 ubiquitin/ISG15 ligase TRIM25-like n=1 Tax=Centroberyx affinis TaxID=166261 RepID=UPI003A5C7026
MAQQGIQLDQAKFCCSICLDLLKDPVTIPCGHSYCMSCIKGHWDEEDRKKIHSCPQCRQTFMPRPVLVKNTMVADIVEELEKIRLTAAPPDRCYAGPGDVAYDVCTGRKLKALKSCLVCRASYCEQHLQPHYESSTFKKHELVDPSQKLQENTVSATAERTERQNELGVSRQKIQQRIQDREKDVKVLQREVKATNRSADKAVEDSEKIFTELVRLIEKRSSEVKEQIRSRQKTEANRAKELQEKLKQEIAELRRKDAELERLSHTEDHTHFLHSYPSLSRLSESTDFPSTDIRPLRYFEDVTAAVSEARDKLQDILTEEWPKISLAVTEVDVLLPQPEPKTRADFLQYSRQITLDLNTAHARVSLSEGNRKSTFTADVQSYFSHPDRFMDRVQVLSREGLTGRCYWEVEWSDGWGASIAVAYKDIRRKGDKCQFGYNDKSWALDYTLHDCQFEHNSIQTPIPGPRSTRIGVYLDHRAGILSFYSASETMTLLHRVQTRFTQPLYPGFGFFGSFGDTVELCKLK